MSNMILFKLSDFGLMLLTLLCKYSNFTFTLFFQ